MTPPTVEHMLKTDTGLTGLPLTDRQRNALNKRILKTASTATTQGCKPCTTCYSGTITHKDVFRERCWKCIGY